MPSNEQQSTFQTNADPTDAIVPVPALQKQAVYTREETRLALLSFPTDRDQHELKDRKIDSLT